MSGVMKLVRLAGTLIIVGLLWLAMKISAGLLAALEKWDPESAGKIDELASRAIIEAQNEHAAEPR